MPTLSLIEDSTGEDVALEQLYTNIDALPTDLCWLIGTFIGFRRMVQQRWCPTLRFSMFKFQVYVDNSSSMFTYDDYSSLAQPDEHVHDEMPTIGENRGEHMLNPVLNEDGVWSAGMATVGYLRPTDYFSRHVQECDDDHCSCTEWFLFKLGWVAPTEYTGDDFRNRWTHCRNWVNTYTELKLHSEGNGDISMLSWQAARLAHYVGWGTYIHIMFRMHWMTMGRIAKLFPRMKKITEFYTYNLTGPAIEAFTNNKKRKRVEALHLACDQFGCEAGDDEQCYNCGHFKVNGAMSHMAPCSVIPDALQDKGASDRYWNSYLQQFSFSNNLLNMNNVVHDTWED